jgi:hypothetical protein
MRAELLPRLEMVALGKQVDVDVAEQRRKA